MRKEPYTIEINSHLSLKQVGLQFAEAILIEAKGNRALASLWLGISRQTLYRMIRENKIVVNKKSKPRPAVESPLKIKDSPCLASTKAATTEPLKVTIPNNLLPRGIGGF